MKRKLILALGASAIILGVLVLGALVYFKQIGLKRALQDLVFNETEGRYSLILGKASVSLTTLSFAFDSLVIQRNPALPEIGIRQVKIANVKLQVANIGSMFRSKKYDIKTLIVDEPLIQIDNPRDQDSLHQKFHLGQQVVKLYPAIESILNRFNLEHLKINRATLGVNNQSKPPLTLGMIDFLIEAWDENRLTENSQLQLLIGQQELKLENAALGFTAIEYNLRKHQLSLSNVRFSTADSITKSHVNVFAEDIVLTKLGYKELFENQRLTYQKVTIKNPKVDLKLILKGKVAAKSAEASNEKEVLTRIIKQSIGECLVDTVVIKNATVNTILQKGADSTVIALPQVNFTLYTFKITNDNESFETGTANIEFNKTTIALTDGMTISCQKLELDEQRNLKFEEVELFDAENNLMVVKCQSLMLTDFNLLPLLFDRELHIGSLLIDNAVLNVPAENIFGSAGTGKAKGFRLIDIKHIGLKNVALNHQSANVSVATKGVSLDLNNIKKKEKAPFTYAFKNLKVADATLELPRRNVQARLTNIDFNGDLINAKTVLIDHDALHIALHNVVADHVGRVERFQEIDIYDWQSLSAERLVLSGKLPEEKTEAHVDTTAADTRFLLALFTVANVSANVAGPNFNIAFGATDVALNAFSYLNGEINYAHLKGTFNRVKVGLPNTEANFEQVDVALPKSLAFSDAKIRYNDVQVNFLQAKFFDLNKTEIGWVVNRGKLKQFSLAQQTHNWVVADSLLVKRLHFGGSVAAQVEQVAVFKPVIKIREKVAGKKPKNKKMDWDALSFVKNLELHPGEIVLPGKNVVHFETIHATPSTKSLSCNHLFTDSQKQIFHFKGLDLNEQKIKVDSLRVEPNPAYEAYKTIEQSIVSAKLYGTTITGHSLDSLFLSGKLHNIHVFVPRFYVRASRDMRLPDGPYVEKPATLAGFIKLPKNVSLTSAKVANGVVEVSQVSEITGQEGNISITQVWADLTFGNSNRNHQKVTVVGGGMLAGQGELNMTYKTLSPDMFSLKASLTDFDLTGLNSILLPLESVKIESGYVNNFTMEITANNNYAIGNAAITYNNLHLVIYKRNAPEEKNFKSELITLVADGLVLKNNKQNATAAINKPRTKNKSTFHYWMAAAIQGSTEAVRSGKSEKK